VVVNNRRARVTRTGGKNKSPNYVRPARRIRASRQYEYRTERSRFPHACRRRRVIYSLRIDRGPRNIYASYRYNTRAGIATIVN